MNEETKESEEETTATLADVTVVEPVAAAEVELGIKETKELLKAFDVIAELVGKVFADGKITGGDVFHVGHALASFGVFADAVKGIRNVDDELKDLDEAELLELGREAFKLLKKTVIAAAR
jgi:hypothetical protein